MTKSKIVRSAAILGAVVIIGAAALSAGPTFAAKGGKHGGGQTPPPTTTTLVVTPTAPAPYSAVHISGCGYAPNQGVILGFVLPGLAGEGYGGFAGEDGCFARDWEVAGAGSYTYLAYQVFSGYTETLMAQVSFTVQ